jgi:hypothetical protein
VDHRRAHLLIGGLEVEQPPSLIQTISSALCSSMPRSRGIDARHRRFEQLAPSRHFAVRMKAAFRLQRERLDAATARRR